MRLLAAFLGLLLLAAPAWAEVDPVQVSNGKGLGRVVITLGSAAPARVRQRGNRIDIAIPRTEEIVAPDLVPRNVLSLTGGHGGARLTVIPGARARTKQNGRVLTVDLVDPAVRGRDGTTAGSRPNPAKPTAVATAPTLATVPVTNAALPPPSSLSSSASSASSQPQPQPPSPPPSASPAEHAQAQEQEQAPAEAAADATPARPAAHSFTVEAEPEAGIATFRRGGTAVLVVDGAASVLDPGTLAPSVERLARATAMLVELPDDEALSTARVDGHLVVTVAPVAAPEASAAATPTGIAYQLAKPGRVLTMSDPLSGQTLLIGTTRQLDGDHARIVSGRSAPGYELLPSWAGVVVAAGADQIDLGVSLSGFKLSIADRAATNQVAPAPPRNPFEIPLAPVATLLRQRDALIASAAAAPPRARGPYRVAAARAMLALGLATEAQALLGLAAADDPAIAQDPATDALTGIAAVLAGRPGEAGGLDNPALPTGGDMALWRGLRDVAEEKPAPALAGAWPLLAAYPDAIRTRIAAPVVEAAASAGTELPPRAFDEPGTALARAMKLAHDGDVDGAAAAFIRVRDSRDERASVRAAVRLTELQLAAGRITPADAAEQIARQTVRWRGDKREYTMRLRSAELRRTAGQWRLALDGFRDLATLFPARRDELKAATSATFRAMLAPNAPPIAPLELVLLAADYADGFPTDVTGDELAALLADKLAALDLPSRAIPVLRKLMDKAATPAARAGYALRLAQSHLDTGDAAAAEAVLIALDPAELTPSAAAERASLLARAQAAQGRFAQAATTMLDVPGPDAAQKRAEFLARANDWRGALDTLQALLATSVPETGELTDGQQDILLRTATAAVQAGDPKATKQLARFERRMTAPRADLFRLMTAASVRGPEDLPRAARELAMSRAVPEQIGALKFP